MSLESFEEIKALRKSLFDSSLDRDLIDNDGDISYKKTKTRTQFNNSTLISDRIHKSITSNGKSTTLLDRLRLQRPSVDDDNMEFDLPTKKQSALTTATTTSTSNALSIYDLNNSSSIQSNQQRHLSENAFANQALVPAMPSYSSLPSTYHSNWKLHRVLLGHTGSVTALTFDPLNKFFVTGSSDRTMKIWDLASGKLKLTLTGHIMAVRGLVISDRHPYMFSVSEDKTVKCWDLEKNKIVRDYHGHLSSVYTVDIHPTLDLIVTAGRDSSVRVWDIRTKLPVYTLTGHKSSVNQVKCRSTNPQIISCSMDSTVKTWDLIAGKCDKTLTYHSKSVRSFCVNDENNEFISGSSDGIKKFKLPNCDYLQDLQSLENDKMNQGNLIINTISSNCDGTAFIGCDNGQYGFWDWNTGKLFQDGENIAVPGSLAGEKGILCSSFDNSGLRLVTGGVDKSVKIWKQVDEDLTM